MRKNDEIGRCKSGGDKIYAVQLHYLFCHRTEILCFTSFCLEVEKSVQIDPCRRENVTLFVEIRLTLGDEIKMTPVGILRRGFFVVLEIQVLARRGEI